MTSIHLIFYSGVLMSILVSNAMTSPGQSEDQYRETFNRYDVDQDGEITDMDADIYISGCTDENDIDDELSLRIALKKYGGSITFEQFCEFESKHIGNWKDEEILDALFLKDTTVSGEKINRAFLYDVSGINDEDSYTLEEVDEILKNRAESSG